MSGRPRWRGSSRGGRKVTGVTWGVTWGDACVTRGDADVTPVTWRDPGITAQLWRVHIWRRRGG
jgi:hypothetical protein